MREVYDEPDLPPIDEFEFPRTVQVAGVIWIVFGALILVNAAINLLIVGAAAGGAQGGFPVLIGVLFGAVFIHVGVQSTRGTAADTLGNGIGSIIFGVLNGGAGVLVIAGAVVAGTAMPIATILGGISILCGIGLLAAGVLALVGRQDYRAWRRTRKG